MKWITPLSLNFHCSMLVNFLSRLSFFLRRQLVLNLRIERKNLNDKLIHKGTAGDRIILDSIFGSEPFLISRFGTTEMQFCLEWSRLKPHQVKTLTENQNKLWSLSGVFPPEADVFHDFYCEYVSAAKQIDICGVRSASNEYGFWDLETEMVSRFQINSEFIDIENLWPINSDSPWVKALSGKRVLVIHPFTLSISEQLDRKAKPYTNPDWDFNFEIILLQAPQTLSDLSISSNWTAKLSELKSEISGLNFDLALIGCGAYGLPLGSYIKSLGRSAIHVGGVLQLFFGIQGKRWSSEIESRQSRINLDFWVRPHSSETPYRAKDVEGGAYW